VRIIRHIFLLTMALILGSEIVCAKSKQDVVQVAASSNIKNPLLLICNAFEAKTKYKCNLISASTGHLYAQIMHGAQFDVLLTSNASYVRSLMNANKINKDEKFTLATGRVVLWSADERMGCEEIQQTLRDDNTPLAMANPGATPYGVAAKEILKSCNLWHRMHGNIIFAKTLGKTYQMVVSKKVKVGFVAVSQLSKYDRERQRYWDPGMDAYKPIVYEAISLKADGASESKRAFLKFLQSSESCEILTEGGYQCLFKQGVG